MDAIRKVLYVEDDTSIRDVFTEYLQRRFTTVITAVDGEDGLSRFITEQPDLVITDIRMPGMNGVELIHAIRKVNAQTPLIVLSAYADQDFLTDSIQSQIAGYLLKPIDEDAFQALLDKLLAPNQSIEKSESVKGLVTQETFAASKPNDLPDIPSAAVQEGLMIVGIGASAGGLEALNAMVAGLPEKNNTAYLIAQHLSPTHKTMLVDLLSRTTDLSVHDAEHGLTVQPDVIYVTPPNKNIELTSNNTIILKAPEKYSFFPRPSVNQLFLSLAEQKKDRAVGVILSGTGSDGAQGMRAINASGGVTIVQNPDSAKYDGMPLATINGCSVDMVIEPGKIGEELVALANFPRQRVLQKYQEKSDNDDISTVFRLLYQYKKVDFSVYKKNTIARRIERRMLTLKLTSLGEYIEYLQKHDNEVVMLYNDILIGVTSFFRDKESFEALEEALEQYLAKRPDMDEFRIWIPGTSTGEEAYSIIITLKKLLKGRDTVIRAFATDIDEDALRIARRGGYSEASVSEISVPDIQSYFNIRDSEFEVKKPIRESVVFSFHNLLADPPFKNIDLVVCRNLLIYFTLEAQRHIMPLLHYALKDHGLLFLGKSENVTGFEHLFASQNRNHKVFRQVPAIKREFNLSLAPPVYSLNKIAEVKREETIKSVPVHLKAVEEAARLILPNLVVVNEQYDIVYKKGEIRYLSFQDGYVSYNLFKMIDPRLAIDVRKALTDSKDQQAAISTPYVSLSSEEKGQSFLRISVIPLVHHRQELYVLYFSEIAEEELPQLSFIQAEGEAPADKQILLELQRTREHMHTLVEELETSNEELQSTNEELQSSNEELQSTNEELETSNEELQSTNEELQTAYSELRQLYENNNEIKEELSSLSKRYERVLDSISDGVSVATLDGTFIRTNQTIQLMTGIKGDALLTRSWSDLLTSFPTDWKGRSEKLINRGRFGPYQGKLINGDGDEIIVSIRDYLVEDERGVQLVWSFVSDVSAEIKAKHALELSEQKYRGIFNNANVGIAKVAFNGTWVEVNSKLCELLGYDSEELKNLPFQKITHPEDQSKEQTLMKELVEGGRDSYKLDKRYICKDGTVLWAKVSVAVVKNDLNQPEFLAKVVEDISQIKKVMNSLEQAQVVFNATQEAIMVTDEEANILSVNDSFESITGYSSEDAIGQSASILKSGKHPKLFYDEMWRLVKKTGFWSGEVINRSKSGDYYPSFLNITSVKDNKGKIIQYVGVLTDISLIKESQEKIDYLANHDTLTGLPNRALLKDRLENALDRAKRHGSNLAMMFVDLDRFKVINDGLGHQVGDDVLVEISRRFKNTLRDLDTVARIGGDEFVILLDNLSSPIYAGNVAQKLIDAASKPITSGEHTVHVGCSIGISIYPNDGIDIDELFRLADIAMYEAKESGRNTYRFTNSELSSNAFEKITLESAIRDGLKHDEFEVHYQPIYDLKSNQAVHYEALIRWNHPKLGLVMPGKFIPVAEESDLIVAISEYVVFESLQAVKQLSAAQGRDVKVAINFSVKDFESRELFTKFKQYLKQSGLQASSIVLELTERMFVKGDSHQKQLFERYEQLGVEIAIDDFGTGYSNLNSLSSMEFDYLKIDRSFVDGIGREKTAEELVKATIAIAKALGHKTIAEGIEQPEQLKFLLDNGCDFGQGYLMHMPCSLSEYLQNTIEISREP